MFVANAVACATRAPYTVRCNLRGSLADLGTKFKENREVRCTNIGRASSLSGFEQEL